MGNSLKTLKRSVPVIHKIIYISKIKYIVHIRYMHSLDILTVCNLPFVTFQPLIRYQVDGALQKTINKRS